MNNDNLNKLIDRYEDNYSLINDDEHNEKFKWKVVKKFRDIWNDEKYRQLRFSDRFKLAFVGNEPLIDHSLMQPTVGVSKLADIYPVQVEKIFNETVFSGETDPMVVGNQVEYFIEVMEDFRIREFPEYYSYKQDRHSASCYLYMFNPEHNFIYQNNVVSEFADYVECGKDISSDSAFSLVNYYELSQKVVEALKKHETLIEKYYRMIENDKEYYQDRSLHLMAYDLMYCCHAYNFYVGMSHKSKKESIEAYANKQIKEQEEQERLNEIQNLENEISEIDLKLEQFEEISLVNVEVTHKKYGRGTIIEHENDRIKVRFAGRTAVFVLNKKYSMLPIFENDNTIIDVYTDFANLSEKRSRLESRLQSIKKREGI